MGMALAGFECFAIDQVTAEHRQYFVRFLAEVGEYR